MIPNLELLIIFYGSGTDEITAHVNFFGLKRVSLNSQQCYKADYACTLCKDFELLAVVFSQLFKHHLREIFLFFLFHIPSNSKEHLLIFSVKSKKDFFIPDIPIPILPCPAWTCPMHESCIRSLQSCQDTKTRCFIF